MSAPMTGAPALDAVNAALATVQDPEINRPLPELGMVTDVQIAEDGPARVEGHLHAPACPARGPEISRPLPELGMVKDVQIAEDGTVRVEVYLTVSGCPMRETITSRVTQAVSAVPGVASVQVALDVMNDEQRAELRRTVRGSDTADPVIPF